MLLVIVVERRDRAPDRVGPRLSELAGLRGRDEAARARPLPADRVLEPRSSPGITILLTLATWLASRWTPTMPTWARRVALATFLGALAQAPLGAITVYFDLHPLLVLVALPALGDPADARRDRGARGLERPRRGRCRRRLRQLGLLVGIVVRRARRDRDVRDGGGRVPGQLRDRRRRQADPAARELLRLDVAARPRDGRVRHLARSCSRSGSRAAGAATCAGRSRLRACSRRRWPSARSSTGSTCSWWIVLIHVTLAMALWAATVAFVAVALAAARRK